VWDWSKALPTWTGTPACSWCGGTNHLVRWWHFFDRARNDPNGEHHLAPYRCDVSVKCLGCGLVIIFGLVVPVDWWNTHAHHGMHITWQEARRRGWA